MRILIFFDLPTLTSQDKRNYTVFRKWLIKNGFLMLQESVYSKLVLNQVVCQSVKDKVKLACPKSGLVQLLTVTENQYTKMEYLVGKLNTKVVNTEERLVVIWNWALIILSNL